MSHTRAKNKTVATVLAAVGGSMGLHRFYLHGWGDWWGWLLPIPSALGWWGVERVQQHGQDDVLSWVLIPLLGVTLAAGCLMALIYGLMPTERWNARYNPSLPADAAPGRTRPITVTVVAFALLAGAVAFMSTLAFGVQRYFEYQIEAAKRISQPDAFPPER
jgi:TM2 domain-containing membrane protein YozV